MGWRPCRGRRRGRRRRAAARGVRGGVVRGGEPRFVAAVPARAARLVGRRPRRHRRALGRGAAAAAVRRRGRAGLRRRGGVRAAPPVRALGRRGRVRAAPPVRPRLKKWPQYCGGALCNTQTDGPPRRHNRHELTPLRVGRLLDDRSSSSSTRHHERSRCLREIWSDEHVLRRVPCRLSPFDRSASFVFPLLWSRSHCSSSDRPRVFASRPRILQERRQQQRPGKNRTPPTFLAAPRQIPRGTTRPASPAPTSVRVPSPVLARDLLAR
mmetsp:Transcript_16482/g.66581  ORF Transcript_16482/g.66581 Transcript_16482/m.66581 type:complete len:268 (+) Transcript_16482:467-1270(+)